MKRMNEVFELPVLVAQMDDEHAGEITKSGECHYCIEDGRYWMASNIDHIEAAAHAINNVDSLADALELFLIFKADVNKGLADDGALWARAELALNAYRGTK